MKKVVGNPRKTLRDIVFPAMVVLLGGLLILTALVSCKQEAEPEVKVLTEEKTTEVTSDKAQPDEKTTVSSDKSETQPEEKTTEVTSDKAQPDEKSTVSSDKSETQSEKKATVSSDKTQPQPEKETSTVSDVQEPKKKRLAEILKEVVDITNQVKENPELKKDLAIGEKLAKITKEGEALLNKITGDDKTKEDAIMLEIAKKYAPETVEFVKTMIASKKQAFIVMTQSRLKNIQSGLELYRVNKANYPSIEEGLSVLIKSDDPQYPPYLMSEADIKDAWDNPILYKLVNPHEYTLKSFGPDGKESTEDDIELK